MPIYIFDLSCGTDEPAKPIGNFRTYVETLLNDFIQKSNKSDESDESGESDKYVQIAKILLQKVKIFSNKMIDKGDYILKICD